MSYYDDDDLINDYMNDDFDEPPPSSSVGPPDDYDIPDEFLNSGPPPPPPPSTTTTAAVSNIKIANDRVITSDHPVFTSRIIDTDYDDTPMTTRIDENISPVEVVNPPPQSLETTSSEAPPPPLSELIFDRSYRRREDDLFQFERFTGKREWRRRPNDDDNDRNSSKRRRRDFLLPFKNKPSGDDSCTIPPLVRHRRRRLSYDDDHVLRLSQSLRYQISSSKLEGIENGGIPVTLYGSSSGISMTGICLPRRRRRVGGDREDRGILLENSGGGNLLSLSMEELLRRADVIQHPATTTTSSNSDEQPPPTSSPPTSSSSSSQLWVDKYTPRSFLHLLSNERINRNVLKSLRKWDQHVFRRQKQRQTTADGGLQDDRPPLEERGILLSGPPGVGKTTLAHIVARQAGYHPMEINASNDRTESSLKTLLQTATSSTQTLHPSHRPNCLILDEVDGLDHRTSRMLADWLQSSSKQKKLRRPIIFIANHKYAPCLKPLLPYCICYDVVEPRRERLVQRLHDVLREEGYVVRNGSLLHELVERMGGDIRSCLHALQFASQGCSKEDLSAGIQKGLSGRGKDERNDLGSVLSTVFFTHKTKNSQKRNDDDVINRIMDAVERYDDSSKTLDGLYLNIPLIQSITYLSDPTFEKMTCLVDYISDGDIFARNNKRKYVSIVAAALSSLGRVDKRSCLTTTTGGKKGGGLIYSNRILMEMRFNREKNDKLAKRFMEGSSSSAMVTAFAVGVKCVVLDMLPYIWRLLNDEVLGRQRVVVSSVDFMSRSEAMAFRAHVELLRYLGLTYKREDGVGGGSSRGEMEGGGDGDGGVMRLEPEIGRLVRFKGLVKECDEMNWEIPNVTKELLAHAVTIESIKGRNQSNNNNSNNNSNNKTATTREMSSIQINNKLNKTKTNKNAIPSKESPPSKENKASSISPPVPIKPPPTSSSSSNTKQIPKKSTPPPIPNFLNLGAAKARAARTARKAATVKGFTPNNNNLSSKNNNKNSNKKFKTSHSGSGVPLNEVIKFKFQKGFTQAVRVPCRMEDLL